MVNNGKNNDERLAKEWLKQQGHTDIQLLAGDPPDYLVDGSIAVEVTRLDRRIENKSGKSKGEEDFLESVRCTIQEALIEIKPFEGPRISWMVYCEYPFSFQKKPKKQQNNITNELKKQIRTALFPLTKPYDEAVVQQLMRKHVDYNRHADDPEILDDVHFCLNCGLCLKLRKLKHLENPANFASNYSASLNKPELAKLSDNLREFHDGPPQFVLQDISDGEGIGIAEELINSVRYCISDKSKKIRKQNKIDNYQEWWLVLVDHVGIVPVQILGPDELKLVQSHNTDFWSRIVIVSSKSINWHFDLLPFKNG